MTPHNDDIILDACLDEVLGRHTPPDLTDRVLQALARAKNELVGNARPQPGNGKISHSEAASAKPAVRLPKAKLLSEPALPVVPALPCVAAGLCSDVPQAGSSSVIALQPHELAPEYSQNGNRGLWAIALAASVLGLGLTVGLANLLLSKRQELAGQSSAEAQQDSAAAPGAAAAPQLAADAHRDVRTARASDAAAAFVELDQRPAPEAVQLAGNAPSSVAGESEVRAVASARAEPADPQPSSDAEVISFVNAELARAWTGAGVQPAPHISDEDWRQRVFRGVLGRSATPAEARQFDDDTVTHRRDQLVERILTHSEYAEEFARHWSVIWTSELLGAKGGQTGSLASRQQLEQYLFSALIANRPFHHVAAELLAATGSALPGADDYNPAVNFLLDGWDATGLVATLRVSRVFLGRQLQCAQCHEHPTEGSSQEQFWAFNSFFRQMRAQRQDSAVRLVNVDFFGERRGSRDGEVFFETPSGLLKTAFPRFLDGSEIPTSGVLATVDRRRELARLVAQSDDLPRAVVNRVWAHFFDYGLLPPVHELKADAAATHSALLERMAAEFVAHNYDLKRAIRWAVLSDPFTRSSKLNDLASQDLPEAGETALFSRYYSRPAPAAEVFHSLVQAQRIRKTAASDLQRDQARIDWLAQFNRSATKDGVKAATQASAAILAQDVHSIRVTAGTQPGGLVPRMAFSQMSFDKKVEHLFLAALSRRPNARETRAAADLLAASKDNQPAALEDIWWALCNSSECVLDR